MSLHCCCLPSWGQVDGTIEVDELGFPSKFTIVSTVMAVSFAFANFTCDVFSCFYYVREFLTFTVAAADIHKDVTDSFFTDLSYKFICIYVSEARRCVTLRIILWSRLDCTKYHQFELSCIRHILKEWEVHRRPVMDLCV